VKLYSIITGTGRCGTSYAAKLLTEAGMQCTHERVWGFHDADWENPEEPAESSWVAAPFLNGPLAKDARVIHLVRHPKHVIESLVRTNFFDENTGRRDWPYTQFVYDRMPDLLNMESQIDRAAAFYVRWNRMIEDSRPDATRVPVEAAEPVWEQLPNPDWRIDELGMEQGKRYLLTGDPGALLKEYGLEAPEDIRVSNRENRHGGVWRKVPLNQIPDVEIRSDVVEMCKEYGYDPCLGEDPRAFWAVLLERNVQWNSIDALFDLANGATMGGHTRISIPYGRTDTSRNHIVRCFQELAQSPNDMIIMLDCDHVHPPNTIDRLFRHDPTLGVVAALAFRRGPPYDPMFFVWEENGRRSRFVAPAEWRRGALYECDAIATCAIGIRQWVFVELDEAGSPFPYFRYSYERGYQMTEDIFFAMSCMRAGISQYCDTSLVTPHLSTIGVDENTWEEFKQKNPSILSSQGKEIDR